MDKKVLMPKLGKNMTQGRIVSWEKKEGDAVASGDVLFVVNNGKLDMEIETDFSGILNSIVARAGDTVEVGKEIASIEEKSSNAVQEKKVSNAAAQPAEKKETAATSVLVLGGGPGGYVAAIRAAQLGAKVTLVEENKIGGTCLNCGCMPTKALMHSAEVYEEATHSEAIGIIGKDVCVDWAKVQGNRQDVSDKLTSGVKALIRANKITLVEGCAKFISKNSVMIGETELTADKIIIATGSRPVIPPILGADSSKACMDSTACLTLDHIPQSMLVVGGGVIGLELGSIYAKFGTKVTIIEMADIVLPLMDEELSEILRAQLIEQGLEIFTGTRVESITDTETGALVRVSSAKGEMNFSVEKVLLCVGRSPNTKELMLENAGISVNNGYIAVNDKMETTVAGIYAVGDCNGKLMFAHAAMTMGETAAENAMGGESRFDPKTSPRCAYVGPEFAGVGMTEKEAREYKIDYVVGRFPTAANGKSQVMGHTDGMIKVLVGKQFGEILGVHILAPRATELIEEATLAIKLECTVDELIGTIHCHPTVAEGVRECVMAAAKRAIHIPNKK